MSGEPTKMTLHKKNRHTLDAEEECFRAQVGDLEDAFNDVVIISTIWRY